MARCVRAVHKERQIKEVADEEFEQYLATRAAQSGMKLEELKRSPRAADLRRDLEEDKIFEHLEKGAKVTDKAI